MTWRNLLFAHWPVAPKRLRPLVPHKLTLDKFDGDCWIAITPFEMDLAIRGLAPLPGQAHIPELNVRTYVTFDGRPGVYFFSLDIASLAAVWGARIFYRLPYFHAEMRIRADGERFQYRSRRSDRHRSAQFAAAYSASSRPKTSKPGELEHFLTERYCLYSVDRLNGRVYSAEIHHVPWQLQKATAEIPKNTMARAAGIELPDEAPLLHFAREVEVLAWPPHRLL
jgi:uncharacterized protein YqjF (DUF2071 family)